MDTQNNSNTHAGQSVESSSFDIKKILFTCLAKWYYFGISVFVCLCIGVFHLLRTMPEYTRTATLVIKESNTRRTASSEIEAMLASTGQITSKIQNEVVAFQAPSLMEEAVSRLGLTVEYAIQGRFRKNIVYNSSVPAVVDFISVPDEVSMSFELEPLSDGNIRVSKIRYRIREDKFKVKGSQIIALGDTVHTDIGDFVVDANPYYYSKTPWTKHEIVTKRTLASTQRLFSSRFVAAASDTKKMSDVLTLTVTDYSSMRADDLINMIITIYNENWVLDQNKMAKSTSYFIKDRLSTIETELSRVDSDISKFKSENLMPTVDATSTLYMNQTEDIERQIRELEGELSVAQYLSQCLNGSVSSTSLIPSPAGIKDSGIAGQISDYNKLLMNRNNIVANSSERNPLVIDMDVNLAAMRVAILESVENEVQTLKEQIRFAQSQQEKNTGKIAASPEQAKDLLSKERLQKVQESLYLFLLQKREENELSQAFSAYNTRIINPPYGSPKPTSPNSKQVLLIALMLGLCIPAAYFYIKIVADNKVRSRKDLELMSVPFLGEIPLNAAPREKNPVKRVLAKLKVKKQESAPASLVVKSGDRNVINEAFRVIRTNLEFVTRNSDSKALMITSFNPGSGKTFISINTAAVLAIRGKKVLLVDGDFRRASSSKFFNLSSHGFADFLSAPAGKDIHDYIRKYEPVPNLSVLPIGTIPPNPSELVSSQAFTDTIEVLKKEYDYLILDCAPVDIVADTQIIAPVADRTIFVVRAGLLEKELLKELDVIYDSGKYNNMSVILNGTESANGYYGNRYSYRYSYGNGYHYGKGTDSYYGN